MTTESLPPEKSSAGRSSSAAISRMTWIASALERVELGQALGWLALSDAVCRWARFRTSRGVGRGLERMGTASSAPGWAPGSQ